MLLQGMHAAALRRHGRCGCDARQLVAVCLTRTFRRRSAVKLVSGAAAEGSLVAGGVEKSCGTSFAIDCRSGFFLGPLFAFAVCVVPLNMIIHVHILDQVHAVSVGDGPQPVMWLAHAALARVDANFGTKTGVPSAIANEEGAVYDGDMKIRDLLKGGDHVWVVLKSDGVVEVDG